ncbi:MAG TPA: response regulator transcription factor [Acidimicrobiales bacterium]|nr:response regulator transcription factor [Acidimicrobiales bacterium]
MARVVVQQRQRLFREGLSMFLGRHADVDVVGTARTAVELTRVCDDRRPDVVLLEMDATEWDPCRLAASLRARHRALRLIGLPASPDPTLVRRAQRSGIETLLSPSCGSEVVLDAVRGGSEMGRVIPLTSGGASGDARGPRLTERERQVLQLIGTGATSKETSARLGISRKTVENYKQRIFAKLHVQNQAHAVALATRRGLLFVDHSMPAPFVS